MKKKPNDGGFGQRRIPIQDGRDYDIILRWPNQNKVLTIQIRRSNADTGNYGGSIDIILPEDQCVTNWKGDDMEAAPPFNKQHKFGAHERLAKQLVMSMGEDWYVPKKV